MSSSQACGKTASVQRQRGVWKEYLSSVMEKSS